MNNEQFTIPVSMADVSRLLTMVKAQFPIDKLSAPVLFKPYKKVNVNPFTEKLFSELEIDNDERFTLDTEAKELFKRVYMTSGLNLFTEITAQVVSETMAIPINTIFEILAKRQEEPKGFVGEFSQTANSIEFVSGYDPITPRVNKFLDLNRNLNALNASCPNIDIDMARRYIKSIDFINSISADPDKNIGDINTAIIEALVHKKPIDFVFFKCPRMVQYRENDKNRLDIITHCDDVERDSREGIKKYTGDDKMVSYFRTLFEELDNLGIKAKLTVFVMTTDVEDMFPVSRAKFHSSIEYEALLVPTEDVLSAKTKSEVYTQELQKRFDGLDVDVLSVESVENLTNFISIKKALFADAYRSIFNFIDNKSFEIAVKQDKARYEEVYPEYRQEHAKFKVANKTAVEVATHELLNLFDNPVIITRGPIPIKEQLLANGKIIKLINKDSKTSPRRIIFADPERDELISN